jgi:hypothetical protein
MGIILLSEIVMQWDARIKRHHRQDVDRLYAFRAIGPPPDSADPVESDGVKETVIQAAICEYLAARRVFFWRQNNMPRFDKGRGIFYKLPKYTPRRVPDIIAVRDGRAILPRGEERDR